MGVFLKDPGSEKCGECPYCYSGSLAYDEQSGRIFCTACGYAIKLPIKKCIMIEKSTETIGSTIKVLKNDVETMKVVYNAWDDYQGGKH